MRGRRKATSVIPAKAGINLSFHNKPLAWDPASAGTTLPPGFRAFHLVRQLSHTLLRGNDSIQVSTYVPWYKLAKASLLREGWGEWCLLR